MSQLVSEIQPFENGISNASDGNKLCGSFVNAYNSKTNDHHLQVCVYVNRRHGGVCSVKSEMDHNKMKGLV